jgi:SAM-dependent methyltransferase
MGLPGGEDACPVCGGDGFIQVLRQTEVPVHQNLVLRTQAAAVAIARGELDLRACQRCGFVYNAAFDASKLDYGPQYENTQLSSPAFQAYVTELVRHMVEERQVRNQSIVEVGCGKGGFLRALVAAERANNTGVGFDPSYIGPDVEFSGRLRFERRFYDSTCTDVPADVVVCRHVIEHVAAPLDLLRAIHTALDGHTGARVFLETPCVDWILRNTVIWDFFYEHCSLFTVQSLGTACARAGFSVQSARHVFGQQYLWLEATNAGTGDVDFDPGEIHELSSRFIQNYQDQVDRWRARVQTLAGAQTLAIWGAGAKGVTFANLIDPRAEYFACVVDVNPAKQGGWVAGTGHPIVAPSELAAYGVTTAVVLNPNYRVEVEAELRASQSVIEVLDIGRS